jgi:hypothetical protein
MAEHKPRTRLDRICDRLVTFAAVVSILTLFFSLYTNHVLQNTNLKLREQNAYLRMQLEGKSLTGKRADAFEALRLD